MIWRQLIVHTAAIALIAGAAAARVVHVHQTHADARHWSDAPLHSHDAGAGDHEWPADRDRSDTGETAIWTLDAVLSPPAAMVQAPPPAVIAMAPSSAIEPAQWRGVEPRDAHVHGPPPQSPSSLRAPPLFLPIHF